MSLWNDEDLLQQGKPILTILTFLVVTNCSMEMEQWGRFKSNGRVWGCYELVCRRDVGLSDRGCANGAEMEARNE